MLEMDCVIATLTPAFEVGKTDDPMVIYCKSRRPLEVMQDELWAGLGRFGLRIEILARKQSDQGNVLKVRMIDTGAWGT